MKKYFSLFICTAITLILLSGCGNYSDSNSAEEPEHIIKTADLIPSVETTDWEPTAYETVSNLLGVTMTVKEEMLSSTGLTVVFENKSDNQCIYGEYFLLEKKINDRWYQVPVVIDGNYGFNDIGYDLACDDTREWTVDWAWLYGSLNTGEYRIVKDILSFRNTVDYDKYSLSAVFIIY